LTCNTWPVTKDASASRKSLNEGVADRSTPPAILGEGAGKRATHAGPASRYEDEAIHRRSPKSDKRSRIQLRGFV